MKFTLSLISVALVLAASCGSLVPPQRKGLEGRVIIKQSFIPSTQQQRVGLDKCKICLDFADQAINVLLNEILQVGVIGTCSELCQALAQKTGKQALGAVCDILCSIVGIEEFVKIIEKADIDPIYYCELLKECPIKDDGDAKFTKFDVMPKSGPQGEFDITFEYTSMNGTGTGEIDLDIDTVDHIPLGRGFLHEEAAVGTYMGTFKLKAQPDPDCQGFLHEEAAAGTYTGTFKLRAQPDPDCDPTQGPCEEWLPGDYTVKIAICNGQCGSKHPHSQMYDQASTSFTITG